MTRMSYVFVPYGHNYHSRNLCSKFYRFPVPTQQNPPRRWELVCVTVYRLLFSNCLRIAVILNMLTDDWVGTGDQLFMVSLSVTHTGLTPSPGMIYKLYIRRKFVSFRWISSFFWLYVWAVKTPVLYVHRVNDRHHSY